MVESDYANLQLKYQVLPGAEAKLLPAFTPHHLPRETSQLSLSWSRHIGARFEQQGDAFRAVVPCGDL